MPISPFQKFQVANAFMKPLFESDVSILRAFVFEKAGLDHEVPLVIVQSGYPCAAYDERTIEPIIFSWHRESVNIQRVYLSPDDSSCDPSIRNDWGRLSAATRIDRP
jgi:hypothetical protein